MLDQLASTYIAVDRHERVEQELLASDEGLHWVGLEEVSGVVVDGLHTFNAGVGEDTAPGDLLDL